MDKIIINNIIPFFSDSNQLLKLKVLNKKFYKNIKCHKTFLKCGTCGNNRFRVISNKNKCYQKDCMVNSLFHPNIIYYNKNGEPVCSFGCLLKS
tara:strand:- start:5 stop:286 length:282 start_codon:yes stop_codon:yes gene_type:complete